MWLTATEVNKVSSMSEWLKIDKKPYNLESVILKSVVCVDNIYSVKI